MDGNVFGGFIGGENQQARSRAALNNKNLGSKYDNARHYLMHLKKEFLLGVSTLCLVYNATGEPITSVTVHDWWGHVYEHSDYPREIGNGQWVAFFHVKRRGTPVSSNAAVVYRCRNTAGHYNDGLMAWDNPWFFSTLKNKAYAEIHPAGYFHMIDWSEMEKNVGRGELQYRAALNGSVIDVEAICDTIPEVVAIYALE